MAGTKKDSIDIGLAILDAKVKQGEAISTKEIAAACDCGTVTINIIIRKALKKLRRNAALQEFYYLS